MKDENTNAKADRGAGQKTEWRHAEKALTVCVKGEDRKNCSII
jgi:hypothetical protein